MADLDANGRGGDAAPAGVPDPSRDASRDASRDVAVADSGTAADGGVAADAPVRRGDRAQYGVCAGLAVLGGLLLFDAARIGHASSSNDPVGPRPVPIIIGVLLLLTAILYAVDVARGGVGHPEEGEDVDLSSGSDWKTLGLLAAFFVLNAVLIQPLGWVISGAILFAGSAYALGNRHHVRGIAFGLALSLATFYAFAIGLDVNLPAGVLQGIL
ncbi:tripartite tricarboxylate transporter TctB family protein [Humibacillus xanthopallidus]|uniref:Putative tricarboxylic transport membrane protein n=1 Tax=Humibacillus xanthopallidus TaxID=412689 RepID=A0A543I1V5_9MICO|nr:tripartite tricarboxylate transporter TctB family protein [Humibacillus xanthopallidus]TQM64573.1 putative tricarboxylic transport membrane protein [Humibacillus xanthopallidus]